MKKTLALLTATIVLFGAVAGGTLAWLTAKANTVVNTFTIGDVAIDLYEMDGNYKVYEQEYQLVPGQRYTKNPTVKVLDSTNVDCYLFVEFIEGEKNSIYLNYESNLNTSEGWTQGNGTEIPKNVWYRTVKTTDSVKSWQLIKNDEISINGNTVTEGSMEDAVANTKLAYKAYAVQFDNLTVEQAWAEVSK